MTKQETSWTRSKMLRKLARHVTNMEQVTKEPTNKAPKQEVERETERKNEHPATSEVGKLVTLKRRNHLQEFHEHMMKLNQERKELDIRIEGERKALAALMKIPRRAHVEIRNNIHTLIFHCDGCQKEMLEGMHCTSCEDFDLCSACYRR